MTFQKPLLKNRTSAWQVFVSKPRANCLHQKSSNSFPMAELDERWNSPGHQPRNFVSKDTEGPDVTQFHPCEMGGGNIQNFQCNELSCSVSIHSCEQGILRGGI